MNPIPLSPDGIHYMRAAEGMAVPSPYHRRWLLPRLLGPRPDRWAWLTYASLAALPIASLAYLSARGIRGCPLLFATALLCAMPGLRLSMRLPVLLDAPSFTGALLVAACATAGPWWLTLPLALALGATRETAPVFAALWAWHPLPLVGLLVAGWRRPSLPPSPAEPWLAQPFRYAWALRTRVGLDRGLYVAPWGAAIAGLLAPTWQMAATVAMAHAQLFAAVDTLRLTVWAAPVLVAGAAQVLPPAWWPVAVLVTAMHRDDRA